MTRTIDRLTALVILSAAAGCGASLMDLSKRGDVDGVQRAIDRGGDVNVRTVQGHSPLTLAAREGHLEVVQALIQGGSDLDVVAWSLSIHPRPRAYRHQGSTLTRERFVNADSSGPQSQFMAERTEIDVNWVLKDGKTPVMLAAERGHLDVVTVLVDNGANLQLTSGGYWVLDTKPEKEIINSPEYLQMPDGPTPAYSTWRRTAGRYVGPEDYAGRLPASEYHGYPRRFYDSPDRKTALDLAYENGHSDVVEFLRNADAAKPLSGSR